MPLRTVCFAIVAISFMLRGMTGKRGLTMQHMATFLKTMSEEQLARRLAPDFHDLPKTDRGSSKVTRNRARQRWSAFPDLAPQAEILLDQASDIEAYQGNIENFIGELRMPIGLAGPLRVNGLTAKATIHFHWRPPRRRWWRAIIAVAA